MLNRWCLVPLSISGGHWEEEEREVNAFPQATDEETEAGT